MRTPHIRHLTHRVYSRVRHSLRLTAWLHKQEVRLALTRSAVFQRLINSSAKAIEATAPMALAEPPVNDSVPVITGSAAFEQVLTTSNGVWLGNPAPTFTIQWQRAGVNIAAATAATYTLVRLDVGQVISSVVTATNASGTAVATSADTNRVTQPVSNTAAPAVTGAAQVGQTLTTTNGTWLGFPAATFARKWQKGGVTIAGATALTYVPVSGDIGGVITCLVTATNSTNSAAQVSNATAAVIA